MITKIKKYFRTKKELKEELEIKTHEAKGYKKSCMTLLDSSTAEIVIGKILDRKIKWFDPNTLPKDEQQTYYNEAQYILNSRVFQNEISAYTLDLIEEIAKKAKDFDTVLTLRAKIVMGELFRERLGNIERPKDDPKKPENPNATI